MFCFGSDHRAKANSIKASLDCVHLIDDIHIYVMKEDRTAQ